MAYSPPRRASYPSRSLSLVCKIPGLSLGFSETNTIGYYRVALTQLGEAYYKQWSLVDINVEQTWETKTRSKSHRACGAV